jgi:hypothetical protein
MIFKITLKNHFKSLSFLLITLVLILGGCLLLRLEVEAIFFAFAFYSIFFLPSLYLHIEYYLKNRGQRVEILESEIRLYDRDGRLKKYASEDLEKVILYKSASLDKGGIPLTPVEVYHYARIISKQGGEIVITCLLAPNVELLVRMLKGVSVERKKQFFASLKF